jgi:hypothetical protein
MAFPEIHNWFSTIALLLWPITAAVLFSSLPLGKAILWTILGAQLLLPVHETIKFQMIPEFDKDSIANLCILVGSLIVSRRALRILGGSGLISILIVVYLLGPFLTSEQNSDPVVAGELVLPGVGLYDAFSAAEHAFILLIPFFVARQFLWREADCKNIFLILVSAEVFYTIPLLFEIRFSPQLHYWVYGYYPTEFQQVVREGGAFRPMVFMGHGLSAASFLMSATIASTALWQARIRLFGQPAGRITAYLGLVLIVCRSLGATVYCAVLAPLVRFVRPEIQMRIAVLLVSIALIYPALRAFDLFPTGLLVNAAGSVSSDRATSLKARFDNEDKLLAKALQRPVAGWGRFGRSRVYDSEGRDTSVTDGYWVIALGEFGFIGFVAEFGLLAMTVFRASSALKFCESKTDRVFLSALSLIAAINILDLLPNSLLVPGTWIICGALLGRAEWLVSRRSTINRSGRRIAAVSQARPSNSVTIGRWGRPDLRATALGWNRIP